MSYVEISLFFASAIPVELVVEDEEDPTSEFEEGETCVCGHEVMMDIHVGRSSIVTRH